MLRRRVMHMGTKKVEKKAEVENEEAQSLRM